MRSQATSAARELASLRSVLATTPAAPGGRDPRLRASRPRCGRHVSNRRDCVGSFESSRALGTGSELRCYARSSGRLPVRIEHDGAISHALRDPGRTCGLAARLPSRRASGGRMNRRGCMACLLSRRRGGSRAAGRGPFGPNERSTTAHLRGRIARPTRSGLPIRIEPRATGIVVATSRSANSAALAAPRRRSRRSRPGWPWAYCTSHAAKRPCRCLVGTGTRAPERSSSRPASRAGARRRRRRR